MRIRLLAVGTRMPGWVNTAYADYAARLPRSCRLELVEIASGPRRGNADPAKAVAAEDARMSRAIAERDHVVALDIQGRPWSTEALAEDLRAWMADGRDRTILIGGPDGLGPNTQARAHERRSLSALTLPHPLVRVILAEQLFRAHSLLIGHPYHRG